MTARHWMQIAAMTSALGLTGVAIAQSAEGTTSTEVRGGVSASGMDTPSSGAIVTPEDKALGMGQDNVRRGARNDADASTSNDEGLNVEPRPSPLLSARIEPPCFLIIEFTMNSPNPVPFTFLPSPCGTR